MLNFQINQINAGDNTEAEAEAEGDDRKPSEAVADEKVTADVQKSIETKKGNIVPDVIQARVLDSLDELDLK